MRLVSTLNNQNHAYVLSSLLQQKGINNQLEIHKNQDWGSPEYGNVICRLWVIEEDQLEEALKITSQFKDNPENPDFENLKNTPFLTQPIPLEEQQPSLISREAPPMRKKQPMGPITLNILITCCLLLFFSALTAPLVKSIPKGIPFTPILSPQIHKTLMYDYPRTFELIDTIVDTYGINALSDPDSLSPQGRILFDQYQNTPYWQGFYDKILQFFKNEQVASFNAPLFEKIREGEIWRLITPCFLHADLFHLFFNMVWLVVLGKQLEQRLNKFRYILFILIAGVFSNTSQYLMSGSNFMGFSGVLCGMLAFIWTRQKLAPWEGYQLEKGTFVFISLFILFMFALQLSFFFLEASSITSFSIGIANTAHLTGALAGFVFARFNFFSWR